MPGYACWKLWSRFLSSEGRPRTVSEVRASSFPSSAIRRMPSTPAATYQSPITPRKLTAAGRAQARMACQSAPSQQASAPSTMA